LLRGSPGCRLIPSAFNCRSNLTSSEKEILSSSLNKRSGPFPKHTPKVRWRDCRIPRTLSACSRSPRLTLWLHQPDTRRPQTNCALTLKRHFAAFKIKKFGQWVWNHVPSVTYLCKRKSKAIPVTGRGGSHIF
jgi:hypothetical protein